MLGAPCPAKGGGHTRKGEKRIEGAGWDGAQHVRAPLEVGIACAKPWRGAGLRWGGFESDSKSPPSRTENGAAQGSPDCASVERVGRQRASYARRALART